MRHGFSSVVRLAQTFVRLAQTFVRLALVSASRTAPTP